MPSQSPSSEPLIAPAPAEAAITSEAELRALLGEPMERAINKERVRLLPIDRRWLAASPLCFLSTCDDQGNCDVSPKGDPPGFVKVLDDTRLAVRTARQPACRRVSQHPAQSARRPDLRRAGRTETLRVNGRARLVREAAYFDDMVVKNHRPIMAIEVDIEQIFFHCPKAFLRSRCGSRRHGTRTSCRRTPAS